MHVDYSISPFLTASPAKQALKIGKMDEHLAYAVNQDGGDDDDNADEDDNGDDDDDEGTYEDNDDDDDECAND
ncbi:hypothetical protein PoB_001726000 [Plakobranchus ocellatus]|uniref:Uncharacterized protein n=1 Tax=Plakobranchus ocellatus TaxID=259542 RepID=A0AAV3Z5M4_9GAST|nr:hypothetical protein PoB_001726000 [Plakobranchus ocellatus]